MSLRYDAASGKFVKVDDNIQSLEDQIDPVERAGLSVSDLGEVNTIVRSEDGGDENFIPFDDPKAKDVINRSVRFVKRRKQFLTATEQLAENDPISAGGLKDFVLGQTVKAGLGTVEVLSRVLNVDTAIEAGAVRGLIRQLKNQGTVFDGILEGIDILNPLTPSIEAKAEISKGVTEGLAKNLGFGDVFAEDLGIPAGPELQIRVPTIGQVDALTPFHVVSGAVAAVREGRTPVELRPFGPVFTTRGAVGLVLDIALSPITYLSFGTSAVAKFGIKVAAKKAGTKAFQRVIARGLGEKAARKAAKVAVRKAEETARGSVLRFAGKTILTDKQLATGANRLKATKAGQKTLELMDIWAASKLGRITDKMLVQPVKDAGTFVLDKFSPTFGKDLDTVRFLRKTERLMAQTKEDAVVVVKDAFKGFNNDEKIEFFETIFKASEREAGFREALRTQLPRKEFAAAAKQFERVKFKSAKFNRAQDLLVGTSENPGLMRNLARLNDMPDEILFQNYMPSIFKQTLDSSLAKKAAGLRKSKSRLKKQFVTENLVKDPEEAFLSRASDLATVGHINRAVRKILKRHSKKSAAEGLEEYLPLGGKARQRFFRTKDMNGRTILGVGKAERIFLPEKVNKSMIEFLNKNAVEPGAFIKALDFSNQNFKAFVTSIFPAFHFRNHFSNQILRFQNEGWKAFKVGDQLLATKIMSNSPDLVTQTIKTIDGRVLSLAQVKKWAKAEGITDTSQFIADMGGRNFDKLGDREISTRLRDWVSFNARKNNFVKIGREVGSTIENHAKMTSFVRSLKDGFSRKQATQIAHQGLFDYGALTAFERNVMRRLIPFYTFGRKNLELQVKTFLKNPGRQAVIFKTVKDMRDEALRGLSEEQLEAFNELKPRFLDDSFAIPMGLDKEGRIMWMTGLGIPQEDLLDLTTSAGLWFRLRPEIKVTADLISRTNIAKTLAQGRVVALKDQYKAPELQFLFSNVFKSKPSQETVRDWVNDPDGFFAHPMTKLLDLKVAERTVFKAGRPTREKEFIFTANPVTLDIVRNLQIARFLTTAKQFGDPNNEPMNNWIRYATGINIINQDLNQSKSIQLSQLKGSLRDELKRSGQGFSFEILASKSPRIKQHLKRLRRLSL